jgi:hypothetical protein
MQMVTPDRESATPAMYPIADNRSLFSLLYSSCPEYRMELGCAYADEHSNAVMSKRFFVM